MSHEIDMTTGKAAIAYAGGSVWHKLGTRFDELMTSEQALEAAGLNFEVKKFPAFFYSPESGTDSDYRCVADRYVTVRTDTMTGLGTVGRSYEPIQNASSFDFMDSLIDQGKVRYEVAGAIRGGSTVWMLAKLPAEVRVSHDDVSNCYLLLTNSHDGSKACSVAFTAIRVVCANTLRLAKQVGLKHEIKIRHSGTISGKLAAAQEALGLANESFYEYGQQARAMSFREYRNQQEVDQFINGVLGVRAMDDMTSQQKTTRNNLMDLIETGMGTDLPGVKGTYWGLLNAVTEYVDHKRPSRVGKGKDSDEVRLEAVTWGGGAVMKERAYELALAAV